MQTHRLGLQFCTAGKSEACLEAFVLCVPAERTAATLKDTEKKLTSVESRPGATCKSPGDQVSCVHRLPATPPALNSEIFAALFKTAHDGICIINLKGEILQANDAFCRMSGYSKEELTGMHISRLEAAQPPQEIAARIEQTLAADGHVGFVTKNRRKDGSLFDIDLTALTVDKQNGRIAVIIRDITQRKCAENALTESEEKFSKAFHSNPAAMSISRVSDGTIVDANSSFEQLFGYSMQETIGRTTGELVWRAPQDRTQTIERLLRDGRLCGEETVFRTQSGALAHVLLSAELITIAGQPHILSTVIDITESKKAEEAASRNRKTFFELVQRAPFGIYLIDSQFRITHMNEGSQNGAFKNVRPIIGRDFSEAMHILWAPSVAEEIISHFRHTLETGQPYYSPRFVNPRRDVETVESYEWELHRMTLPDGNYGVVCYYFDSTRLREAEEALRQAHDELEQRIAQRTLEVQRQADQLRRLAVQLSQAEQRERKRVSTILHDHIQQLIVAARMQLMCIRTDDCPDKQVSVQTTDEILSETLEAVRTLSVELSPPVLHSAGLVGALDWLAAWMRDKNRFTVHVTADAAAEPAVEDTRFLLFQCVRELLLNSLKHSGVWEAQVCLSRPDPDQIQLVVADCGEGFDPNLLDNRAPEELTFGLFSIRQRLAHIGGKLHIESAPGCGARFTLTVDA